MEPEYLTKLEVAERHLCVAIQMLFERKDMIAIHTLACVAQGILTDLGREKGVKSFFEDVSTLIKAEKQEEFKQIIRAPQNFFKRADRDSDAKVQYSSELTLFQLLDATRLFVALTKHHTPETCAMTAFFFGKYPHWFDFESMPELQSSPRVAELFATFNPADFKIILDAMTILKEP